MIIHSVSNEKPAFSEQFRCNGKSMADIIILPGSGGSSDAHWQTHWERADPHMRRFQPSSWDAPDLTDWISALDRAVEASKAPPLLVAHSLACLLVAYWQRASPLTAAGAFLVGVPDPRAEVFPAYAATFTDPPKEKFRFPSLIVASADDPFATFDYACLRADQWGSGIVNVGPLGHIGSESALGD